MPALTTAARLLALSLFFALTACLGPSAPAPLGGTLSGDLYWSGVVRLRGDVTVAEGATLAIAPGTTVLFLPPLPGEDRLNSHPNFVGSELIVRGTLRAVGTAGEPIVFRDIDPAAPPGSWGGVNLVGSPEVLLRHCRFTQADSALHSRESAVVVEESLFEGNRVGIRFHSSDMRIERNLLRRNGTAIRFHFGAPLIRANDIRENGKGIFITSHPRDYLIEQNNIVASDSYQVVLGEDVPVDVRLPGNYWGMVDGEEIAPTFFDGRREPHLGRVLYRPVADRPVAGAGISWKP